MSREIKFRAWDKEEKFMLQDIQSMYDGSCNHKETEERYGWISCFDSFIDNDNYVVMQYTGLTDKNGTEIYEGDILKMHQFLFDGNEYEKETIGVIKWGEYGWLLSQIDGKEVNEYMGYKNGEGETYLIHFYGLHEESFEVIGNIYENAELLK